MRNVDIITFDCYGTLIDWENGIVDAFAEATTVAIPRHQLLDAYHCAEARAQNGRYRTYREVLREVAAEVSELLGLGIDDPSFLPESLPRWGAFADTNAALVALRNHGYLLGILSNTDDDLLEKTREHFPVQFDLTITAQQVHSYKPRHAHWLAARESIGNRSWWHAAQSNFHDIVPANELGIPNVWINRKREQPLPGGLPGSEFPDMEKFAAAMT